MVMGMAGLTIGYLGFGLLTMLTGIIAFVTRADRARGLAAGHLRAGSLAHGTTSRQVALRHYRGAG